MRKIVNDRGRLIGPRGCTNDGHPVLVLDRSGLVMITDRVWRFIRTENPWVGDSHSVYYQTFQIQGLEFGLGSGPKLRRLKKRSQKPYQDYSFASPQVVPCIATLGSYDQEFPPLQTSADDARNKALKRIDHRLGTHEGKAYEASAMRILSIRNETEQIHGIFMSWKTRALNMGMLVMIVRVPLLVMPWIGCGFLGIRTHDNHICGRTFGSTVRFTPVVSEPQLHEQREGIIGMIGSKRTFTNMTSEPNQPVFHNSSISIDRLPSSVKKTLSNKIENLVEVTYVPENSKIPATDLPLINPYSFYHRQKKSTIASIRHLIHRNQSPPVKEIIQHANIQQCGLKAITAEQYVTIEIPQALIDNYLAQGFTHLHLGAIRLILTLHARRSLPISGKIALLDITFKEYQHALIGTLITTLTNGSVVLTISPNFTLRLTNPTVSQRIKIQIQLIGAVQDPQAETATLHHQVLYRVQDHALDLPLPNSTGDAFFMFNDQHHGPVIVNIPKMIGPDELAAIVPLEWITNYEKAFPQLIPDVHTTTPPMVTRSLDGIVKTVFQRPGAEGQSSSLKQLSFRRICTISPITIQHENHQDDPPVHYYENGKLVYVSHINGHFIWDVDPNPPDEPDYKPKFSLKKCSQKPYQDYSFASPQVVPCIATLGSYDQEFPPLQASADDARVTRRPYVAPQGNKALKRIDHRLGTLEGKADEASAQMNHLQTLVKELRHQLATQAIQLDHDLKTYIHEHYFGPDFHKKNQELLKIKAQLKQIEDDQARKTRPQALTIDPLSMELFPGNISGVDKEDNQEKEKSSNKIINLIAQNDSTSEEDNIAYLSAIAMVNPANEESDDEGHLTEEEDNRQPHQTAPSLPQPDLSSSKSGNFYFTIDDIDPDKYRQKLNDFGA
ncbi:hypothetical protein PIB30_058404 [Stylosanthes scabra]|uniref:Uncharacterized protein n=1 Tax=Stylosanthes scabra TaxID=79078 RepID=A0ABU6RK36_9FABA|nr:hypothetical protein [Stylosanthes scabra]